MKTKLCPLLIAGTHSNLRRDCLGQDCAWYENHKGLCAVLHLASSLRQLLIAAELGETPGFDEALK